MSRLKRFESHRFLGDRRTMKYFDCDDVEQFEALSQLSLEGDLLQRNLLQTFGPDESDEAENRSFSAARASTLHHSSPQIH